MLDAALIQNCFDHTTLVIVLRCIKTLLYRRGCFVGTRHLNGDGVLQIAARQTLNFWRESGREQQRGALLGQETQDALQVRQETNVEHAVGFIEHHIFHLIENGIFGFDVIEQSTRCGHQNFDAFFKLDGLGLHVHAAKHHRTAHLGVLGVHLDLLCHLVGQFARGQQHQGTDWMSGGRCRRVFVLQQTLQQWQRKRSGFTRARLRCAHHVFARQHHRDGLGLNGGHGFVAHFGYGTCQRFSQR